MGRSGHGQPLEPPTWTWLVMTLGAYWRGLTALLTLHRLGEIGEEFVGQFLGRAIDQALAELRQLAADLGFDIVAEQRAAILVGQRHGGAALGEAGHAALAFPGDLVA